MYRVIGTDTEMDREKKGPKWKSGEGGRTLWSYIALYSSGTGHYTDDRPCPLLGRARATRQGPETPTLHRLCSQGGLRT